MWKFLQESLKEYQLESLKAIMQESLDKQTPEVIAVDICHGIPGGNPQEISRKFIRNYQHEFLNLRNVNMSLTETISAAIFERTFECVEELA